LLENIQISVINELDQNKACGPDGIPAKLVKPISEALSPVLAKIFNICLENEYFPPEWKRANVIPLYKKFDRQSLTNYRPFL